MLALPKSQKTQDLNQPVKKAGAGTVSSGSCPHRHKYAHPTSLWEIGTEKCVWGGGGVKNVDVFLELTLMKDKCLFHNTPSLGLR
jgi:hypothetical protein